ncbi:MAG TPA: hypothetical protein VNI01_15700 [Elusimicrobiota bacterium]|nr:hypothetical protein [Elusimicrobiota bacterium]
MPLLLAVLVPCARAGVAARPATPQGNLAAALVSLGENPARAAEVGRLIDVLGGRGLDPASLDRPEAPNRAALDPLLVAMGLGAETPNPESVAEARARARALPADAFTPDAVAAAFARAPAVIRAWVRESREELSTVGSDAYADADDHVAAAARRARAARQAAALFSPYLPAGDPALENLRRDWERYERTARQERAERGSEDARRAVEEGAADWAPPADQASEDSQGGLMEAPPPKEGAKWDDVDGLDGFLGKGDGDYNGYDGWLAGMGEEHAERNAHEAELAPEEPTAPGFRYRLARFQAIAGGRKIDPEGDGFPLDAVRAAHIGELRRIARQTRPPSLRWIPSRIYDYFGARRFWKEARLAYGEFEDYVRAYLSLFGQIGALGPGVREHLAWLKHQNQLLLAEIQELAKRSKIAPRYGWGRRDDPGQARREIEDAIYELQAALAAKDREMDEEFERTHLGLQRRYEEPRGARLAPDLLVVYHYYLERWRAALADPDPRHKEEFFGQIVSGVQRAGPIIMGEQIWIEAIPPLARMMEIYNLAVRRGAGRFLPLPEFGLAAIGLIGAAAAPLLPLPLAVLAGLAGASWALWIAFRSLRRALTLRAMGNLLENLARAAGLRGE